MEKGNFVIFGPKLGDSCILHPESGNRLPLAYDGVGSWVMDVTMNGQDPTPITVDSGAQESVCPVEWGKDFGLVNPEPGWIPFRTASGSGMNHYGQRSVRVYPF